MAQASTGLSGVVRSRLLRDRAAVMGSRSSKLVTSTKESLAPLANRSITPPGLPGDGTHRPVGRCHVAEVACGAIHGRNQGAGHIDPMTFGASKSWIR
jgi:hypothetical protein